MKAEINILRLLAKNPRASLVSIAKELDLDRQTVKSRIVNLINKEVILNFGGIPNLSMLGYVTYYLLVRVVQNTPTKILRQPFEELRNIFYAGRVIGDYDMILYLNAKNPKELNESIELLKKQIGKHIIYYDLLVQEKVHCWCQYTEGIYSYLLNKAN